MNRDDMERRFEQWLDEALAAEDPPDGIDAEMLATMAEANERCRQGRIDRRSREDGSRGVPNRLRVKW